MWLIPQKKLTNAKQVVITNNGKPVVLLTPLNDRSLEETISAVRRAKAINAVKMIQQESLKNGTDKMTLDEINYEIKQSRKERKR